MIGDSTQAPGQAVHSTVREALLTRISGEYAEMPGLSLTLTQAQRLLALDGHTCARALDLLVRRGFLTQNQRGAYIRRDG